MVEAGTTGKSEDYVRGIADIADGGLGLYIKITIIGIGFLLIPIWISYVKEQGKVFRFWILMVVPILLFGYFLGVQLILHVKSGMYEIYLIPATVAFAYFWLIDVYCFLKFEKRFKSAYYMFVICMALVLITEVNDEERARVYAEDGKNTTAMLSQVAEYANENPNITIGIGYEQDFSASVYLQEKCNIDSAYNLLYSARKGNIVCDGYVCDVDERATIILDEVEIFMGYPYIITSIMEEYGIQQENFELYTYGDYVLYVKSAK